MANAIQQFYAIFIPNLSLIFYSIRLPLFVDAYFIGVTFRRLPMQRRCNQYIASLFCEIC